MAYEQLELMPDPSTTPKGPGYVKLGLEDKAPGMTNPLNDGSVISIAFKGNYWEITLDYPRLTPEEAATLKAHVGKVRGTFGNFYVKLPGHGGHTGTHTSVEGQGTLLAGDTAYQIKLTNANYNALPITYSIGDKLKLTNSNKIYEVVDVTSDATYTFITLNSEVLTAGGSIAAAGLEPYDIRFRVKYSKKPTFSLSNDGLYGAFSVVLRENIR
jgi:hypothetical protein